MTTVWIVVKRGVYMQEIYGPFFREADARAKAEAVTAASPQGDGDGYHQFDLMRGDGVSEFQVEATWSGPMKRFGEGAAYSWKAP